MQVMVQATFDLLELCVQHNIEKVIAASSASVTEWRTISQRPRAKIHTTIERYMALQRRSMKVCFGLSTICMGSNTSHFDISMFMGIAWTSMARYTEVLIRWMERLEAGQPPIIFGDGRQTMDFVHVRDVARANILGAKANISDEVFNVASGTETSLAQLAQSLTLVMGRHGTEPRVWAGEIRQSGAASSRFDSKSRAVAWLSGQCQLEEGLATWWIGGVVERHSLRCAE